MKTTIAVLLISFALNGCLGSRSTLDEIGGSIPNAVEGKTYVEAYIEFTGPQEKWAGPQSFMVHIVAKDKKNLRIWVTPPDFLKTTTAGRKPASAKINLKEARERLKVLARALHGSVVTDVRDQGDEIFRGCLFPVRAWLINSEGGILENQGCRGQPGWEKVASATANFFVERI